MSRTSQLSIVSEDQKKELIEQIISFFQNERDESIGIIAAENMLEFMLNHAGKFAYNKGLDDAKSFLKQSLDDLEVNIDSLRKQ